MQLLASYSFLHLYLHEGNSRAIEAHWRGFVSSPFLRQALTDALALARKHQISGWLADDRLLGPVRPVDLEWIATVAFPSFIDLGLQRLARLDAADPLNQMLIGKSQENVQQSSPLDIRVFTDLAAARAWVTG